MSQRTRDQLLGRIALELKVITQQQLELAQAELARTPNQDLGQLLLQSGVMTPEQWQTLSSLWQYSGGKAKKSPAAATTGGAPSAGGVDLFDTTAPGAGRAAAANAAPGGATCIIDYDENADFAQHDFFRRTGRPSFEKESQSYHGCYTVHGEIGQGGIGRVLLGYDHCLGREVAIKETLSRVAPRQMRRAIIRFLNEARITGQLEHPGVVPVHDLGLKADGHFYYTMRFVRGKTLQQALKECEHDDPRQAFTARLKLLDPLIAVCDAMAYAHSQSVIHRDLKPANVVVGHFGETLILDWGLAKTMSGPAGGAEQDDPDTIEGELLGSELTRAGEVMGTPAYMAPEQTHQRYGPVDQRSDVYALGVMLYQLLTGVTPYAKLKDTNQILTALMSDRPSPVPAAGPADAPSELLAICEKAMAKKPEQRFADAGELGAELRAWREGKLVSVYAYSRSELLRRFVRKYPAPVLASLLIVFSIVAAGQYSLNTTHHALMQERESNRALNRSMEQTKLERDRARHHLQQVGLLFQYTTSTARLYSRQLGKNVAEYFTQLRGLAGKLQAAEHNGGPAVILPLNEWRAAHGEVYACGIPGSAVVAGADGVDGMDLAAWNRLIAALDFSSAGETPREGNERISAMLDNGSGAPLIGLELPFEFAGRQSPLIVLVEPRRWIETLWNYDAQKKHYDAMVVHPDGRVLYDRNPEHTGIRLLEHPMFTQLKGQRGVAEQILEHEYDVANFRTNTDSDLLKAYRVSSWYKTGLPGQNRWIVHISIPYDENSNYYLPAKQE